MKAGDLPVWKLLRWDRLLDTEIDIYLLIGGMFLLSRSEVGELRTLSNAQVKELAEKAAQIKDILLQVDV